MSETTSKDYFKQAPDSLVILRENKQAWAFEHTRGIWRIGEAAGFKFQIFTGKCGIFHEPIWKDINTPQSEWDFKDTYRVASPRE